MKLMSIVLTLFLFLPLQANVHKYYFSFTEINYNPSNEKLEVSLKVFYNDLQEAILTEQDVEIEDPVSEYSKEIEQYVQTHFSIKNSTGRVKLNWVGVETELDAVWIYLQSDSVDFTKTWTIESSIFVDIYPNQNNIINFFPDKGKPKMVKGLSLNQQKRTGDIKF